MSLSDAIRLLGLTALLAAPFAPPALWAADDEVEPPSRAITNSIGMKLVKIPKGKFTMGAAKDDNESRDHEKPLHEVEITKDYYLGAYEVTQKQHQEVMGNNPSYFSANGSFRAKVQGLDTDDFPVDNASWDDAKKFIEKLNALEKEKKARRVYRLPTEAEWERACRGKAAKASLFHYGDKLGGKQANYSDSGLGRTSKVGSYKPNSYGLYDMHGNVWEWCSDEWNAGYYANSPAKDPPGPGGRDDVKVHRGGCYNSPPRECRSSHRTCSTKSVKDERFGFRVAMAVSRD